MSPSLVVRYSLVAILALASALVGLHAQVPGRNVNMASGQEWPGGDPFLQRQNEPSVAASTRNPLHLLAGVNDYRTVDLPRSDESTELGDAWLGLFTSTDGGQRWSSTLVPGYPQDDSQEGAASPLKGYAAGADPVVRAGNSGLMYYAGLAFDRGATGKSAIFVTRFIDNNNKESGNPFAYLGTSLLETRTGVDSYFVDKPWMAVDIPRSTSLRCTIQTPGEGGTVITQTVPAGAVYVAYTLFQRDAAGEPVRSDIFLRRSINCGATWEAPIRVSDANDTFNQGPMLAVDPTSGDVYVAYRRFSLPGGVGPDVDGMLLTRVSGKKKFPPGLVRKLTRRLNDLPLPERFGKKTKVKGPNRVDDVTEFDQGSSASELAFRTNAYPTMTFDGTGRVYIAWSERGFARAPGTNPLPTDGDARVVLVTSKNGKNFTDPVAVDDSQPGHQIMPSLTFAGGKLMLIYYDVRETRAQVFGKFIKDLPYAVVDGVQKRQTIDIRASMATPGATPVFGPSVKVSDYMVGKRPGTNQVEQLQVNPPNLPLFRQGTTPFMGDYIDLAPAPSMVPLANGRWGFNTAASPTLPVFHAVWTDNRDVRPPADGNWANYTPPIYTGTPPSLLPPCMPGQTGMRNQNPYTTRITGELVVGSPGNHKTLSPTLQRSFVVFAQNTRTQTKYFRMTILAQPPGGRASFKQFPLPPYTTASEAPLTVVDVSVPARSTAVRTVYVTSSDPNAQIAVDVSEIAAVGAPGEIAGGAEGRIVLNPDIDNPDIDNPDIDNPDIDNPDIDNAEVHNPDIDNPDIDNPDIDNPDIDNPDIDNPDIDNPDIDNLTIANPDIDNPDIDNPDIDNPDIDNPDIDNPDIDNPDIDNSAMTDITWTIKNTGNTTTGYNVNLFLAQAIDPALLKTQLILHKTYKTPVSDGCTLKFETRNVIVSSIPRPTFITPTTPGGVIDPNDPSAANATLWLAPGETGKITLRVLNADKANTPFVTVPCSSNPSGCQVPAALVPNEKVTPGIVSQPVGSQDAAVGVTEPPVVTPSGTNMYFIQSPTTTDAGAPIDPAVSVQVRDGAGAVVPGATVTLALGNNPSEAVLSGPVSVVTNGSGIATFPALAVSAAGAGYTLVATATGFDGSVVSVPFDVTSGGPLTATVSLVGLGAIFDGSPKAVSATTVPFELGTSVTYNESSTAPSAIGAYAVVGTVTELGYVGSASATHLIASTIQAGGFGGGPYGPLYCGPGVFANGLRVAVNGTPNETFEDINYALTSGQLLCSDGNHPVKFGGGTTPNFDLSCPSDQVMVGIFGTTGGPGYNVVTSIGARCQLPSGVAINEVGPLPGGGTTFGPIDCPSGQAVTGVVGGQGAVVDSIALVCSRIDGLVSRWSLDTNADDSVGSNNALLTDSLTYGPGRIGPGVSFGTAGYIDIADDPSLRVQRLTLSAWVNPAASNTTPDVLGDVIINKATSVGNRAGAGLFWRAADGRFVFVLGGAPSTPQVAIDNSFDDTAMLVSDQSFTAGLFHHVAATYDGATMRLYVDGALDSELAYTTTIPYDGTQWAIGSNPPNYRGVGFPRTWQGVIDDVRIYGRALSAADVAALHAEPGTIPVTVTLGDLSAVYDGSPKSVSVTTSELVTYSVTYNGIETVPSDAGPYAVEVTVTQAGYTGSASDTLVIGKAPASVTPDAASKTAGAPDPVLTGALAGFLPSDGVTATYTRVAGETLGTYGISATLNPSNVLGNYEITYGTGVFTILPAPVAAGITITGASSIYDGTPKPVTVVTTPVPGLSYTATYDGSSTVPSAIGAYFVSATISAPGYTPATTAAIHKIASTLAAGGPGGAPYTRNCSPGAFATGFDANNWSSYGLWNARLLCETGGPTERFVLDNSQPWVVTSACGVNQVMVGFHGLQGTTAGAGPFVKSLGARCQDRTGVGAIFTIPAVGIGGTAFGPYDCPAGQAVVSVVGGAGGVLDSVALVCAPIPAITSVSPAAQVAPSQMLTVSGSNLLAVTQGDVLFNQGAGDIPAPYLWVASATRTIVRLPSLAVGVPTTVRVKNPSGTVTTAPFPISVTSTPGTPVLTSLLNQCSGGTPITTVTPGGQFAVEGDGIDTSGTTMVWTNTASGLVITQTGTTSTGGPTGRVCSYFVTGAPAGLTSGTWNLQLRTTVGGFPSALSNAIVVTVP